MMNYLFVRMIKFAVLFYRGMESVLLFQRKDAYEDPRS